jgi:hypothetical protein
MMWWVLGIVAYLTVGLIVCRLAYLFNLFGGWDDLNTFVVTVFWPSLLFVLILLSLGLVCKFITTHASWPIKPVTRLVTRPTKKQREEMEQRAEENRVRSDTPQW